MTLQREILPDTTRFLTRVCVGREHLLQATKIVNHTFEYLLAVGAKRFDIGVVAYVAMSDHYHLVVHDFAGRMPAFTEWFNAQLARSLNCVRGRWGSMWEGEQPNQPEIADGEKVLDKMAYTLANPTLSGLVAESATWVGARSGVGAMGRERVIPRPRGVAYFDRGSLPEEAVLQLIVPPLLAHLGPEEVSQRLREAVAKMEAEKQRDMAAQGRRFMGARRVGALSWRRRATTPLPRGRWRVVKPLVLASSIRDRELVLRRIRHFRAAYAVARSALLRGERQVFPPGTYWLRVHLGVPTQPS
ncbi:MAG: hypothetical protein H6745_31965 [Deltaproteobacteria bacterium]|nr:hypothetical protein [Deltaproteobacteria bacterium]